MVEKLRNVYLNNRYQDITDLHLCLSDSDLNNTHAYLTAAVD